MPLTVATIPDPTDSTTPITKAYGHIAWLSLDVFAPAGRLVLNVYRSEEALDAGSQPAVQLPVSLGQVFVAADPSATPPVAGSAFPTLPALMADPEFAAAFTTVQAKLETALLAHPALAGSTRS